MSGRFSLFRIAVVAHLRHPIAHPFMGGMEAHCHGLVRGLQARGHDVTLFASGDSDPVLPLAAACPQHYEAELPWALWHGSDRLSAFQEQAFRGAWAAIRRGRFDVVHNNAMHPALHAWAARDGQAMVTSLHVPPFAGLADAVRDHAAPWLLQTATSRAHLGSWWRHPPATARVVHNGIDTDRFGFVPAGNGRAVWAGRITPNKGTAVAIAAARIAGVPLDLIGPIDCMDYWRQEVAPQLDRTCVHHGHVGGEAFASMLGAASVLLATPMWDEPFGLVAAEAMACGVPVAALARGALAEVVGPCGVLADDAAGLAAAIPQAMALSRAACRQWVDARYSAAAMLDGYEAAYAAAVAGACASSAASTVAVLA